MINTKYSYNGGIKATELNAVQRKYDLLVEARIALYKTGMKSSADQKLLRADLSALRIACNAEQNKLRTFKRQTFLDRPASEFNDTEIEGSCFYQDKPYSDVFPPDIKNVVFRNCNLDNCNIPIGATVNGGTNKHYKTMNDQEYWILDKQGNPIEPRDAASFDKCGLSKDPKDIPVEKIAEPITYTNDPKKIERDKINSFLADPEKVKAAALAEKGVK